MAGDPARAAQWQDAAVYVAFLADTPAPTVPADITTAFGSDWYEVGLLDGDEGFTESRDIDTTNLFSWGGILTRVARRNYMETHSFTANESPFKNVVIERLARPGSTLGGPWKVALHPERVKIAFEMTEGTEKARIISYHEADIQVDGDINRNESDLEQVSFMATIYPDGDGNLWTPQDTTAITSS